MLNAQTARELGNQLQDLIAGGQERQALDLSAPILSQRIPFRLLDLTGRELGMGDQQDIDRFLDGIAEEKTMGRYYPNLVAGWLAKQTARRRRPQRALMLRKALTYLSEEQRARAWGELP